MKPCEVYDLVEIRDQAWRERRNSLPWPVNAMCCEKFVATDRGKCDTCGEHRVVCQTCGCLIGEHYVLLRAKLEEMKGERPVTAGDINVR